MNEFNSPKSARHFTSSAPLPVPESEGKPIGPRHLRAALIFAPPVKRAAPAGSGRSLLAGEDWE
jgi:hypothetical protein